MRDELIERVRRQDWVDDPIVGFTTPAGFEDSPIWPGARWSVIDEIASMSAGTRDVHEYLFTRAADGQHIPVAFLSDRSGDDTRMRVYVDKAALGYDEPRRPLVAPEDTELPPDLARFLAASRSGDRPSLEGAIRADAVIVTAHGEVSGAQLIEAYSAQRVGGPGVPFQFCTVTSRGDRHAVEFISWRRPPHAGLAVIDFSAGMVERARLYEGPVRR